MTPATTPTPPAPAAAALANQAFAYDPAKPLAAQLQAAARVEYDDLIKFNLQHARDQLVDALGKFEKQPTGDNLTTVNGFFAHGIKMLGNAGKRKPPGGAGLKEGAQLQKVA